MITTIKNTLPHNLIIILLILFLSLPSFLVSSSSSSSLFHPPSILQSHNYNVPRGSRITIPLTDLLPFNHPPIPSHLPIPSHPNNPHHPTNPTFDTNPNLHLNTSDLDTCLVEVEEEDECLREGDLLPKVFSCDLKDVVYNHHGNPYKKQERLILSIYTSLSNNNQQYRIQIIFDITESQQTIFVHKSSNHDQVLTSLNQLGNGHLKCNPSSGDLCLIEASSNKPFHISNPFYKQPTKFLSHNLSLHTQDDSIIKKNSFLFDCKLFSKLNIHVNQPIFMKIRAEIIKNATKQTNIVEYNYLELNWQHDTPTYKPPYLELRNSKLHISNLTFPSEAKINFPNYLLYLSDDEANDVIISTNLTTSFHLLYFSLRDDQHKAIHAFRFSDLKNNNLLINTRTPSCGHFEEIFIEFKATNSYHNVSKGVVLKVKVVSNEATSKDVQTWVVVQQYKPTNIITQTLNRLVNKTGVSFKIYSDPLNGNLVFKQENKNYFTAEEINQNCIMYNYTNSRILPDSMSLKVISNNETFKIKILIKVLGPIDFLAPVITSHKWILMRERSHQLQIKNFDASITQREEENDRLTFQLVSTLDYAKIVFKTHPLQEGIIVTSFTRKHLKLGFIYFDLLDAPHEMKQELVSFQIASEFTALTKTFSFELIITHLDSQRDENLLETCTGPRHFPVKLNNHQPLLLTSTLLCHASNKKASIIHITTFPFFLNSNLLTDAGLVGMKIKNSEIRKDERNDLSKVVSLDSSHSIREINYFTTAMLPQSLIYFVPSKKHFLNDVANMNETSIAFDYTLNNGNTHHRIIFTIPPNNLTSNIFISIGSTITLTQHFKLMRVPLTQPLKLINIPLSGVLAIRGQVMKKGQTWTMKQLLSNNVWFQHRSGSCSEDTIIFDIGNSFYHLHIIAASHHDVQTIKMTLHPLDTHHHAYTTNNTNNKIQNLNKKENKRMMELLKDNVILIHPKHGRLLHSNPSSNLQSPDMTEKNIIYESSHPSESISMDHLLLFSKVKDGVSTNKCWFSIINITLHYLTTPPFKLLIKKELKVDGLRKAVINDEIINDDYYKRNNKNDVEQRIEYIIHQAPVWGRIVNSKTHTRVTSFTVGELKNRVISYELGRLRGSKGVSSLSDSALIYLTDGVRNSTLEKLQISIRMLKSTIKKRSFRQLQKQHQQKNRNRKRLIKRKYRSHNNLPRRLFSVERKRKNNLGLKVRDIKVKRGGKHKFIVTFKKPSKKRRSMSETRLILEKPPSHGKLVVLNKSLPKSLVKTFGEDLQMDNNNFENINLLDISNEVPMIYEHDGSRTNTDNFILTLSNDVKSIQQAVAVKISPKPKVNLKAEQILTTNLSLHEDVPIVVSIDHLSVKNSNLSSDQIEFELFKLPSHGYVKVLDQNIRPASQEYVRVHETFTLTDVIQNKVIFVPLSASVYNDSFDIQVNAQIPVITMHVITQNLPMKTFSFVLKSQNESSGCLSEVMFEEVKLKQQELECTLISLSKHPDYGRLSRSVFNGKDFMDENICYQGISLKNYPDNFQLRVNNCNNWTIALLKVNIEYEAKVVEDLTPKLLLNVPLMVTHGNSAFLTKSNLYTTQSNTPPSHLVYTIIDQPKHGILLLNQQPCERFSQNDVDTHTVAYKSNRIDDSMIDYFLFNVDNVKKQNVSQATAASDVKSLFFSILVQPAVKATPKLLIHPSNSNLVTVRGQTWLPFNSSHLKTLNFDSPSGSIIYHIKFSSRHGRLENTFSKRIIRRRFSQKDLDENRLRFVLKERMRGYNDTIVFKVSDQNKTILDNQKMKFSWALMQFHKTFFKLCLSSHPITVSIIRLGNFDQSSSVKISLMPESAIENIHYVKMSNDLINFAAGQTKADWVLKVLPHSHTSQRTHLTLRLTNATNAMIGLKSRVFMEFIDEHDDFCSKRKIKKSSVDVMLPEIDYDKNGFRNEDDLLQTDLSFYNEKQRRRDFSSMNDYSLNIHRPCSPSTKSLLFFQQQQQQMFMCDGRRWVKWNNAEITHKNNKERSTLKSQKTCPLGWELYGDHCFLASKSRHSWLKGEKMCRRDGGHLTFVTSKEHLSWLSSLTQGDKFWTGLNNRLMASRWEAVGHQHSQNYMKWSMRKSCVQCRRHRCAQVNHKLEYEKRHCLRNYSRFVCVKPARLLRTSRKAVRQRRRRLNRRFKMT